MNYVRFFLPNSHFKCDFVALHNESLWPASTDMITAVNSHNKKDRATLELEIRGKA